MQYVKEQQALIDARLMKLSLGHRQREDRKIDHTCWSCPDPQRLSFRNVMLISFTRNAADDARQVSETLTDDEMKRIHHRYVSLDCSRFIQAKQLK